MNFAKRMLRSALHGRRAATYKPHDGGARFSPGSCAELIALQKTHPKALFSEKFRFGLKQIGTLVVVDWIAKNKPARVLEMGAGLTAFFDRTIGANCDYWMVDDAGFYNAEAFAASQRQRKNTTFVSGLIGEKLDDLPENQFDLIFSISVIEHAPNESIQSIADHMARLLRPGGRIVHSLDLPIRYAPARVSRWYNALKKSGFDVPDPRPLADAAALVDGAALMEPTHIVHEYYGRSAGSEKIGPHEWLNATFIIDAGLK